MTTIPKFDVSDFLEVVNQTLESAYPFVYIEGEISDLRYNDKNPFVNFTLKDERAALSCSIIKYKLETPLEDGMKVVLAGKPDIYIKSGWFKFNAQKVTPSGEGALKRAYELLKKKLANEGLFEDSRKRLLPQYPQMIGVISSRQAAGYGDFIKVLNERWGGMRIQFIDVQVQGEPAPQQIIEAIQHFNQREEPPEVIALLRGGGSLEDLHAFNSESVARAVAGSRVPVLVGVGHERDVTLAGLVADKRASTPTNAAETLIPHRRVILESINVSKTRMMRAIEAVVERSNSYVLRLVSRIEHQLAEPMRYVGRLKERLQVQVGQLLSTENNRVTSLLRTLKGYDPEQILKRGYSIVRKEDKVITRASQVKIGEVIMLQLSQGKLKTKVEDVQE